jgi:hypothetical protein
VQRIQSEEPLRWVRESATQSGVTGFDVDLGESSTWVLHAMNEHPGKESDKPADDVRTFNMDEGGISTGYRSEPFGHYTVTKGIVGRSDAPEPPWRRLRWAELASRLLIYVGDELMRPSFRWTPPPDWKTRVRRPGMGSLDRESLNRVVQILIRHSASVGSTKCYFHYAMAATGEWEADHPRLIEGVLGDTLRLYDDDEGIGSASNFWPEDRSWFVYSDFDLFATRISGSGALVDSIRGDPEIETLDYP